MYYLYIKTHNTTGLKYLGQTSNSNYHDYSGSGKLWKRHLDKHGYDYSTVLLLETDDKEKLKEAGIYYSNLWNIVENSEWANLQEEKGCGISSSFAKEENLRRMRNGTHPFCDENFNKNTKDKRNKTIKSRKSHNFLGGEIQRKRSKEGRHHMLGGEIQKNAMKKIVGAGEHVMQQGNVLVVDSLGNTSFISKEKYQNQSNLVHVNSIEGKRRLGKTIEKSQKFKDYLRKKLKCPHCNKEGSVSNMKRWHFDKCKKY